MSLRVVIYAAKSTADEKGSIPQQVADCEKFAEQKGWISDGSEHDEAASAWSGSRGRGLERAMERAEALAKRHGRAGLLVFHSNRLARGELVNESDARHLIDYLRWAGRVNVELHSVSDDASFTNDIVAFVVGQMNALDSKAKSAAVKRGMRGRRAKLKHTGGAIYGYDRDAERGLILNPEQAPTVRRIFQLIASGKSQAEAARILNREGVRPLRGKEWVQGSLSKLLRTRTYLGQMKDDDGEWVDALHEAIIDPDLWEAATREREAAAKSKGRKGGPRPKAGHLLLRGFLRHATCGSAMTPVSHDAKRDGTVTGVYECAGRRSGLCGGLRVSMDDVDGAITRYLADVGIDADESLRLVREAIQAQQDATAAELAGARREAVTITAAWDRMWGMFKAGDLDADDWKRFKAEHEEAKAASDARVAQLETQETQAAAAPEALVPAVADALSIVRAAMANDDADAVRAAIERLFSGFLVGERADMPDQTFIATAHDTRAAKKALRERIAAMEQKAGRTVAEANTEYWQEEATLLADLPEPEPDKDDEPVSDSAGIFIMPQPREDAFDGKPLHYVDDRGRSAFRRVPLTTTNNEGLTT
jgi:DNA invertase Pin-like site-specific DNA recombinase